MTAPFPRAVSLTDIGEALGISPQAAWNLASRDPTFPSPVRRRRRGRLWDENAVREWAKAHNRGWREPNADLDI